MPLHRRRCYTVTGDVSSSLTNEQFGFILFPFPFPCRANLWLRSAVRVLVQLATERLPPGVPAGESLYSFVRRAAPWDTFLADPREEGHRGTGHG